MTGIELSGEAPGLVKSYWSPDYTRSELGTNAFGQGIEITPIQMVKAVSAIANGGEMVAPRIIHSVVDDGYRYTPPKTVVGHPISAETAETLTEMLRQSLQNESSLALVPGYSLAGKTGTAEIYIQSLDIKVQRPIHHLLAGDRLMIRSSLFMSGFQSLLLRSGDPKLLHRSSDKLLRK